MLKIKEDYIGGDGRLSNPYVLDGITVQDFEFRCSIPDDFLVIRTSEHVPGGTISFRYEDKEIPDDLKHTILAAVHSFQIPVDGLPYLENSGTLVLAETLEV